MTSDEIGHLVYLLGFLALIAAAIVRQRRHSGSTSTSHPIEGSDPSRQSASAQPTSTALYLFIWAMVVVALIIAALLYQRSLE